MYLGKRIFDIIFSFVLLIIIFPFFLLIAIIIKIDSKGHVFYKAKRVGQYGEEFRMWKFRTMIGTADKIGPSITVSNDKRVTRFGKILRRTKIDEFPSFINVLYGEMSIVGPRPECIEWVKKYSKEEKKVLFYKPGITGPAQVKFKNEEELLSGRNWHRQYIKILRYKLSIDLEYYKSCSFFQDIKIIFKTIL